MLLAELGKEFLEFLVVLREKGWGVVMGDSGQNSFPREREGGCCPTSFSVGLGRGCGERERVGVTREGTFSREREGEGRGYLTSPSVGWGIGCGERERKGVMGEREHFWCLINVHELEEKNILETPLKNLFPLRLFTNCKKKLDQCFFYLFYFNTINNMSWTNT